MRGLVSSWVGRRSGKYKDLESLLGHLSHAATVIHDGRLFLRHLFSLLSSAKSRHHHVRLDRTARADLCWWSSFLRHWNGRLFLQLHGTPDIHLFTNASGSLGCGGVVMPDRWFQVEWPATWAHIDISVKELVPIVVASSLWGASWLAQRVCFHSNNMAVVAMLQNRSAKDLVALHLLRCLYFYSV